MAAHRYSRRRLLRLATLVALGSGTGLVSRPWGVGRTAASPVARRVNRLARLEPDEGTYLGVNLDWGNDSAAGFAARLGVTPAVYVQFVQFPLRPDDATNLNGFIDQVAALQGMGVITLQPFDGLAAIGPADIGAFADRLGAYNARGVPLFLRFAHEMNGSWYPWSQQPSTYVRAFRAIADAVHDSASQTAMLWAPNYGAGYPFYGGQYQAKPTDPDFALLDTNHDGILDQRDDMYAPYYPGDDVVDWVGMSLYHWGDRYPWGKNIAPEPGKFLAQLTGSYNGSGGDDRTVPDFYATYADGHGKPLAIVETAAFYNTAVSGDDELTIKRQWWQQVFAPAIARDYPGIKMINWFEWRKYEIEVHSIVDWTASQTPALRDAFRADLPHDWLRFAPLPA